MLVRHKLYIHFRLTAKFDGLKNACLAQTLHLLRCFLCMDGGYSQKCSDNPHPFQATRVSDGYNAQKHQNWPHPFSNQDISDGRTAQKRQNAPHPFSNQDISDGRTAQKNAGSAQIRFLQFNTPSYRSRIRTSPPRIRSTARGSWASPRLPGPASTRAPGNLSSRRCR